MENVIPRIKAELQKLNVTPEQWKSHLKKAEIINQSKHEPYIYPSYSDNGNYYIGLRYRVNKKTLFVRIFKSKIALEAQHRLGSNLIEIRKETGTLTNLKYYFEVWLGEK